jgi:hypothetical protein
VVWTARPLSGNGYYVAVFNIGDSDLAIDRAWKDLGIKENAYNIRDLWEKKNMSRANQLRVTIHPQASIMWKLYQ